MNIHYQADTALRVPTDGHLRPTGDAKARRFAIKALAGAILVSLATVAQAGQPDGGVVTRGDATISSTNQYTTIHQTTAKVVINWNSFSIGAGETVQFIQPDAQSVALNRVLGADPSVILGNLIANGKVFLLNPNGVLFGDGASVNVGGLVASTMNITDENFLAGRLEFTDAGAGSVVNRGTITTADGGHVVLMGRSVSNDGIIAARLGTVALAAGEAVTMDVGGDGLLNVAVSTGAVNALAQNGGMIRADGGRVLLTAQAAGQLLNTVVNNTGTIQAQTIENRNGTILLLGDMQSGTLNLSGTLDASAPEGGNGGFIETSAARVLIGDAARVTTAAPFGTTGTWLIDPQDFTIGSAPGDNISGATLSAQLVNSNISITTAGAGNENGDIFVNDAVTWSASGAPTTLALTADRNVDINAAITATNGNLTVCCGQDVNVNAAITTTNGSVLLAAGRDINQRGAITVTDGNLMMCAANDVNIFAAITLTRGTADPTRSLGLPLGLTLSADTDGTGPGIEGGTVVFAPLAPLATVTAAPVSIYYNPVSYAAPTNYGTEFTLTEGAALRQYMLVFADGGDKEFDGTTATTLTGLKGAPPGVILVAGPNASANYTSSEAGADKQITFTGYTLGGANADAYALPFNCCGPVVASTTGTINPAAPPPTTPPPTTPPPTTRPPTTPRPTTPPPTTPPPTTPPPTTPPPTTPPTTPPPTTPPPTTPPPTTPPPTTPTTPPTTPPPAPLPPRAPWTSFDVPVGLLAPNTPEDLLEVTPETSPPVTLTVTQPVEVPVEVPYVAPVLKPKPYRN